MNSLLRTRYSLTFIVNTLILVLLATGIYANNSGSVKSANSDEETADMNAICPPPTITAQPQSITTCEGSGVTFAVTATSNGTGSITYQWKKNGSIISGATGSNYSIAGITDANAATYEGSYVVVVTKSCGAVVTSLQVTLNVNTVNAGSISGAQTICPGADPAPILSTINGTGEGSVSYQWQESKDNSTWSAIAGATLKDYDPDTLHESRYYRRATSSLLNGVTCQEYSNVVSIIVEQISVLISSNSPLCEGSTLELTASGGASYSWSGPNSFISTSQNPSLTNIPLTASGAYEVTATSTSGCSTVISTTVTINPLPTPSATNNSPVCEGASLSLSSCGGTSFSWTGPLSFTSGDKHPAISEASMDHAGVYSVVVTNDYGCSAVATTVVVVNPRPSPTADNSGPACEGGSVNLSASGGDAYLWSGPSDFSSGDQNPSLANANVSANGTYVVTVTNTFGCSAQATTTVLINAPPTISISSMDSINIGGLLSLNTDGGVTYTWTGPNGFSSSEQNPTISNATLAASGTYTVTVTSADGCMAIASVTVAVYSVAPDEASSNSPADEGGSIYLRSGEGESYYWEGPNGFTSTDQNPVLENADASYSGTYTVTVTDVLGNSYSSTTEVVIYPAPSASSNGVTCEGSIINLSASGGDSYSWSGPNGFSSYEQNPIITSAQIASGGTYSVVVTRSDGSTRTAATSLSVNPSYSVSLPAATSCDAYTTPWGQEATTSGDYSHLYSSINGCDSLVSISVTINSSYQTLAADVSDCGNHTLPWGTEVTSSGVYSHTYISSNGCDSTVTINVNIHPKYDVQGNAVLACDNYTLPWGELVTATGDYSYTYPSVNACDSTVHVHVTINPSYQVTDASVTACDTYQLPWGETASTPGTYTHTYTSSGGCDSLVSIKVDLNKSYSVSAEPVLACNSHTLPWGDVVSATGDYSHVYTTSSGCDSTVSVHVTVNHSYNLAGSAVNACTSYTLPWGEVATVTDDYDYTYRATTGCDSTVTIHVTINPVYDTTASAVTACNSYALPWGAVATSTGDYNHTYASLGGCDSTVSLHVTINHDAATSLDAISCDNYTLPWGASVAASGDYTHTYATVNGCDSVVTAHVSINHAAVSS
ncbi:MAG: hypothetical protein JST18_11975, partial [Bacteroidetes bacterium]|nr:hypothetical protein [Bacteroidota bacterium]